MNVEVVPYDPRWPRQFGEVRDDLVAALGAVEVVAIEHVGSTSVPGLAAKPRLDIVVDKSPMIQRILAAAGLDADERQAIDAMNRLVR